MAVNTRTLLNRVLRTIGETEIGGSVTTLTDTYQLLVLTFLNQIKEEIEDAHDWRALRQVVNVTITGGTNVATIVEAGERSRLVRIRDAQDGVAVPLVFDVTDAANPIPLQEMDLARLIYMDTLDTASAAQPFAFALDNTSGDVLKVQVYPTPTAARNLRLVMTIPQARLEAADMATNIVIPVRPLELGTVWYALMERGEQQGVSGIFTEDRYRQALDDLVSRDAEEQGGYELIPT